MLEGPERPKTPEKLKKRVSQILRGTSAPTSEAPSPQQTPNSQRIRELTPLQDTRSILISREENSSTSSLETVDTHEFLGDTERLSAEIGLDVVQHYFENIGEEDMEDDRRLSAELSYDIIDTYTERRQDVFKLRRRKRQNEFNFKVHNSLLEPSSEKDYHTFRFPKNLVDTPEATKIETELFQKSPTTNLEANDEDISLIDFASVGIEHKTQHSTEYAPERIVRGAKAFTTPPIDSVKGRLENRGPFKKITEDLPIVKFNEYMLRPRHSNYDRIILQDSKYYLIDKRGSNMKKFDSWGNFIFQLYLLEIYRYLVSQTESIEFENLTESAKNIQDGIIVFNEYFNNIEFVRKPNFKSRLAGYIKSEAFPFYYSSLLRSK